MEKNVCGTDRFVRAVLGTVLLWVLFRSAGERETGDRSISVPRLLITYAIAELSINVFAQWCPLNALLGVDSCRDR